MGDWVGVANHRLLSLLHKNLHYERLEWTFQNTIDFDPFEVKIRRELATVTSTVSSVTPIIILKFIARCSDN